MFQTNVAKSLHYSGRCAEVIACYNERGDWNTFHDARRMLEQVSERFDSDYGRSCLYFVMMKYYLKRRMIEEASSAVCGDAETWR